MVSGRRDHLFILIRQSLNRFILLKIDLREELLYRLLLKEKRPVEFVKIKNSIVFLLFILKVNLLISLCYLNKNK